MDEFQELHIENDFWDDFIVEAFEHIEDIENNAMTLEQNPEDMDIIHTMFRAFHTIKGLSGFVEHTVIQEIAHKTETVMDFCRKGEMQVNTKIVDAILKSSDYIKCLCENVEAYKNPDLIENIKSLLEVLEQMANPDKNWEELQDKTQEEQSSTADLEQKEEEPVAETEVQTEAKNESASDEFADFFEQAEPLEEITETEKTTESLTEISAETVAQIVEEPVQEACEEIIKETAEEKTDEKIEEKAEIPQATTGDVFEFGAAKEEAKEEEIKDIKQEVPTEESKELKSFQQNIIEKLKGEAKQPKVEMQKETVIQKTTSTNEEYMKVANYKIDHLVDLIGELIINQSLIEQYVYAQYNEDRQLVSNMSGFLRITRDLQNISMSLRMVSLKSTFQKITRIARDTIQELGKDVEFVTSGESTEIDRVVAEKLLDPLVHLIKNAISHGVEEKPQDRIDAGKTPKAKVELNAYSKRGKIFIEIKDNGRGINTEIVYQKALEKGLIESGRTYSDAEIREFILLPGFSTAKVVDNISGRGVGMDVVQTQILKIGGKVDIQSAMGKGSTFTLEVPVNHAIMNGTIIEMHKQQFVVPTVNVKEFLQPDEKQWILTKGERTMIRVRDNIIPIVPPTVFFKNAVEEKNIPLVMVLELDQELRAVPITNVVNRQEVVVKPVGEEFNHLKFISGMSILGTGKVSLILDIDYLFKKEVKE